MSRLNYIQQEIIKVLTYFDYFRFPLSLDEIHRFIGVLIEKEELKRETDRLLSSGEIFCFEDCFLLINDPERVERKLIGKKMANKRMKRAKVIASLIMSFPFVRMVSISGSLSKGYADKSTDIDFFIVTTENQLWTARTFLHLLKKVSFLFRLEHSFCMNYFLSESHLEIEEQNYFTAVELATLIPNKGKGIHSQLIDKNKWLSHHLPNVKIEYVPQKTLGPKYLKWLFEALLKSKKLNDFLMKFTDKRWRKKWAKKGFDPNEYDLAFKTDKTVSKNHPSNYQKKILDHIENNKIQNN